MTSSNIAATLLACPWICNPKTDSTCFWKSTHCSCSDFLPTKQYRYGFQSRARVISVVLPVRLRPISTVSCALFSAKASSLLSSAIYFSLS